MLRQISTRQLSEWRAYADLEPFDETRADLRAAQIVQALITAHSRRRVPLKNCMLEFRETATAPRSPEDARAQVRRTMDVLMAIYGTKRAAEKGK